MYTAKMLATAPGGRDRCTCRNCKVPERQIRLRRTARTIERRTVADEVADYLEFMTEPADTPDFRDTVNEWLLDDPEVAALVLVSI